MFSAQTWTRSPRDTLDPVERAAPHTHPERPQIEGRLNFDFHTGHKRVDVVALEVVRLEELHQVLYRVSDLASDFQLFQS